MESEISRGNKTLVPYAKKLKEILVELDQGLILQDCALKLMISLANDLLDFAQMKNGKFRK